VLEVFINFWDKRLEISYEGLVKPFFIRSIVLKKSPSVIEEIGLFPFLAIFVKIVVNHLITAIMR